MNDISKELKANVGDLVRSRINTFVEYGEIVEIENVFEKWSGDSDVSEYYVKGKTYADGQAYYLWAEEFELYLKNGEEEDETPGTERKEASQPEPTQDAVNHPSHYTQGKFETIEIIEEIAQGYSDGYVAYCVGNAIKYLSRAPHKHATAEEDLRKAVAYINFALEKVGR